jgi:hypothetical protein
VSSAERSRFYAEAANVKVILKVEIKSICLNKLDEHLGILKCKLEVVTIDMDLWYSGKFTVNVNLFERNSSYSIRRI